MLFFLATPAFADRDEARREFAAGQAADARQEWSSAIEHYLRANDLVPHPFAMYNIAQDYERLGKLREAAHWYERYLGTDPKDRGRVERQLGDLTTRPGTITVTSNPDGAEVAIDGAVVGRTPYSAPIRGGAHRVVVQQGSAREERDVLVEFGEPASAAFAFAGAAPTGVAPLGTIDTQPPGPNQRFLGYVFGFSAGTDARGNGSGALTELGIRYRIVDGTTRVGKTDGLLVVDFLVRVALSTGKLAPYVGAGWGFANDSASETTASSSGYVLAAGVRYDFAGNDTYTLSLVGEAGLRYYKGLSSSDDHTTLYVPISGAIQFAYHYPVRAQL
ncbi:MAG: PEGA domain-containing protein [Kofleriaceae bacterium]